MKRISLVLVTLAMLALAPTQLFADSVTCPTDSGYSQPISNNLTNVTGCELGSTNNDSVAQVNADTMFNQSNWQQFGAANGSITGLDGVGTSGTLTLNVNWGTVGMLMIVFKDGNGNPPVYVGYLIEPGFNGTINWISPFANAINGSAKDVSHIGAYFTPGTIETPEPASLFLMGTGLLGAGRIVRKRFQK
jgi:hypothetical protein